jgi:hypothetical protein
MFSVKSLVGSDQELNRKVREEIPQRTRRKTESEAEPKCHSGRGPKAHGRKRNGYPDRITEFVYSAKNDEVFSSAINLSFFAASQRAIQENHVNRRN